MHRIRRGDIWWVSFDPSLGGEIRKTRPAVILSNNPANEALNRVVVVPLSSRVSRIYPGEALVNVAGRQAKAMADQITAASKLRLREKIESLQPADLKAIENAILLHLGILRPT
jgi:mRNA interferase MazF